jgi:hypothetical protein
VGLRDELTGTWRVVTYERITDGVISYPMSRDPRGYFTYDAQGRMSVQVMDPSRPKIQEGTLAGGDPEEVKAAAAGYLAYCAAYTVDEAEGSVTHTIDVHLLPNGIGSSLKRFVKISGDTLTITIGAPTVTGRLTLQRVK